MFYILNKHKTVENRLKMYYKNHEVKKAINFIF